MPEWLKESFGTGIGISTGALALRLVVGLVFGCVIAGIYRLARRNHSAAPTFPATLVMLAVLSAMVPQVIGDHVARAFSLVGALSIVRFRTVVDDTHDIAFVIFAVLVGMAVGAGNWEVASIGTGVVGIAAFMVEPRPATIDWTNRDGTLAVRVGVGRNPEAALQDIFARYLERHDLESAATGRQGAALDLTYKVRLRRDAAAANLVDELNRLEGIQNVELRRR